MNRNAPSQREALSHWDGTVRLVPMLAIAHILLFGAEPFCSLAEGPRRGSLLQQAFQLTRSSSLAILASPEIGSGSGQAA